MQGTQIRVDEPWHVAPRCIRQARQLPARSLKTRFTHPEVNLVTALVPSDTACFASSPGRMSLTDVWISLLVTVGCSTNNTPLSSLP